MRIPGNHGSISTILITAAIFLMSVSFVHEGNYNGQASGTDELPARNGEVSFTNVSKEAGLSDLRGNFFSWGDFDNDGHQDLLVDGKRLFRNSGPPAYHFTEATEEAGISSSANSGVFGDFDNDGWMDIFCGGGRSSNDHPEYPDILWHNRGDGTFEDVTGTAGGITDTYPTVSAGWGDMNRDGYLDLYMVNYENGTYQGYEDFFWMNDGDGTFSNRTVESGMDESDHPYQGRGVSWGDFNNDGWQDLYVSNYRITRNYLYRNEMGSMMTEVAQIAGVEGHGNNHPVTREGPYYGHSLGSVWGDLDNDGDLDLWVTNLAHKDPWRGPICDDSYLFRNMGEDEGFRFIDVREGSGIPVKSIPGSVGGGDELMVSCAMADYDNDGDLDIFLPQIYGDVSYAYSYLYRNDGDFRFTDVTSTAGVRIWNTYGSAWCDYNEDGWVDLVTGGGNWDGDSGQTVDYSVHLYRNDGHLTNPDRGWLEIVLEGRESNTGAVGARAYLGIDSDGDGEDDRTLMREVQAGSGAHGQQDSPVMHFGLGDSYGDINLKIQWPMGREVAYHDITPGGIVRIFEPAEEVEAVLSIGSLDEDDEGFTVNCLLENPSHYPLKDRSIMISHPGSEEPVEIIQVNIIEPEGSHEFSYRILTDDKESFYGKFIRLCLQWSYPRTGRSTQCQVEIIPYVDQPPVSRISCPDSAYAGAEVEISGRGSYDPEGTPLEYRFDLGDGTILDWSRRANITHEYEIPGTYSIYLSVRDGAGLESLEDGVHRITIEKDPEAIPVAVIDRVTPEISDYGDDVVFSGTGYPTYGEKIRSYLWESDLEGRLSTRQTFNLDDLVVGRHVISFTVQDTSGSWSDPDMVEIEVREAEVEDLWVEIYPTGTDVLPFGRVTIYGRAGPEDRVVEVEVKVDGGEWEEVGPLPEWEYILNTEELSPDADHVLIARATDGESFSAYREITFRVEQEDRSDQDKITSVDETGSYMDPFVITGLAIGAVVLIAFFVIIFVTVGRKGRGMPDEEVPARLLED
ncbi:MAG: FG-GAP-like repeat-containing protein [Thermoplasmatota archaeon]